MTSLARRRFDAATLVWVCALALIVWLVAATIGTLVGSTGSIGAPTREQFWFRLRDHVFIASLVGAALASAGVVYQAILRNPLADPYLLGASGGAMLGSYLWRLQGMAEVAILSAFSPHALAMVGAVAAILIVLVGAGARGRLEPVTAILIGVIVNAVCGAVFMLLNTIYRDLPGSGGVMTFLVGDIQTTASFGQMLTSTILIGGGAIVLMAITPALNVVRLSEDEATSLGVRVHRIRWIGLLVASLVTAAAVAISGPIGFVGLICPHVARWMVGSDNRRLLPVSAAMGAAVLVLADAVARMLLGTDRVATLIPVGVITALIGGPALLVILVRMKR